MTSWNPWQAGYYGAPQPNPQVYVPPPTPYSPGYWEQPAWSRPQEPTPTAVRSKYPNLNPILAVDTTLLRFDVRKPPRQDILASTWHSNRHLPALVPAAPQMRLISKHFPWTIEIMLQMPVTCEIVWDALHAALQEPIADSEWGMLAISDKSKKQRDAMEAAAKKRVEAGDPDKRLKRVDWLGGTVYFKGLEQDEEFEKLRLMPGGKPSPETWLVKLGE
ncbi:hypothetical protein HGRIS_002899 [Hohenbuehelia grisea]|uniref:DUF6699 domain-containing protein n=1 Tax=Hohenbuehelia grisea TaxID=104357 RepID=A0ABR3JLU9_9AGAR